MAEKANTNEAKSIITSLKIIQTVCNDNVEKCVTCPFFNEDTNGCVISDLRPVNIMFLDEPFESLGNDEIEIVADLVQEKARDKSLFLITHHQSFNPINVNDITVELDENKHTIIS